MLKQFSDKTREIGKQFVHFNVPPFLSDLVLQILSSFLSVLVFGCYDRKEVFLPSILISHEIFFAVQPDTHTNIHSLSHTHIHTLSLSLTNTHTHTYKHAHTHAHTLSLFLSQLTHTHSHTHIHKVDRRKGGVVVDVFFGRTTLDEDKPSLQVCFGLSAPCQGREEGGKTIKQKRRKTK